MNTVPRDKDAVRKNFPTFYHSAVEMFGNWGNLLRRADVRVTRSGYFEPVPRDVRIHSMAEYRVAALPILEKIRRAGRPAIRCRWPHLALPVFHDDLPAVLNVSKITRQWIEMNSRIFPALFQVPGLPRIWSYRESAAGPEYHVSSIYYSKNAQFHRWFRMDHLIFCVLLYELPTGEES